jgi:hypothetical protein
MTAAMFGDVQADLLHLHRNQYVSSDAKVDGPCFSSEAIQGCGLEIESYTASHWQGY